jgi:hypothetical protein
MYARSVKLVALGVGVVSVCLGVAVACAQAQPVATGPGAGVDEPFPVTKEVVFDAKEKSVTPQIGLLRTRSKVQFRVKGLAAGQTLEIDFRVQQGGAEAGVKGPFARSQRWRGRYTFTRDGQITAGPVETTGEAAWKYDVVLRQKDDTEDVWGIDPMIVIER